MGHAVFLFSSFLLILLPLVLHVHLCYKILPNSILRTTRVLIVDVSRKVARSIDATRRGKLQVALEDGKVKIRAALKGKIPRCVQTAMKGVNVKCIIIGRKTKHSGISSIANKAVGTMAEKVRL